MGDIDGEHVYVFGGKSRIDLAKVLFGIETLDLIDELSILGGIRR